MALPQAHCPTRPSPGHFIFFFPQRLDEGSSASPGPRGEAALHTPLEALCPWLRGWGRGWVQQACTEMVKSLAAVRSRHPGIKAASCRDTGTNTEISGGCWGGQRKHFKEKRHRGLRAAATGCPLSVGAVAACKDSGPALGRVHPKWLPRVGAKKLKGSTASGAPGWGTGLKPHPHPRC